MTPTPSNISIACSKCKKTLRNKDFLKCSGCHKSFDLQCTGNVTSKRYLLMTPDTRNVWKCKNCHEMSQKTTKKQTYDPKPDNITEQSKDNITRRKRVALPKSTSYNNVSQALSEENIMSSTLRDISTYESPRSLPNTSYMESSKVVALRAQVEDLTVELSSAHDEISNLNIENKYLHKLLEDCKKKNHVYNTLLTEQPLNKFTPSKVTAESSPVVSSKPTNIEAENKIKMLESEITNLNKKIKTLQIKLSNTLTVNKEIKLKSDTLINKSITLSRIQQSTKTLQKTIKQLEQRVTNNSSLEKCDEDLIKSHILHEENIFQREYEIKCDDVMPSKPKLLLLSDFHGAELLLPLSKIRRNDYDFSADILHYGTTERVLQNVQEKIVNFKKSDCLVIMCGGSDYRVTPLKCILNLLETTINKAVHTNVVICNIPYSINDASEHYNNFIHKLNSAIQNKFSNLPHVWLQPSNVYLGRTDYQNDGNQLSYNGKWKLAQYLNKTLRTVNEAYYNSCNFL
jgi:hypothetical protein